MSDLSISSPAEETAPPLQQGKRALLFRPAALEVSLEQSTNSAQG